MSNSAPTSKASVAESNATLDELVQSEYEHGFYTDIEEDRIAPGLSEDVVRLISAKKNEPQYVLDWRLKAFRKWREMPLPNWAQAQDRADRFRSDHLLRRAEIDGRRPEKPRRSRSRTAAHLRKTRHSAARTADAGRRRRRCRVRFGIGRDHLQRHAAQGRRDFLSDLGSRVNTTRS